MAMIQIRNVPEALHRELKARAARAGMSLSDYLLAEMEHVAARATPEEVLDRLAARDRPGLDETPAEALRAEREAG